MLSVLENISPFLIKLGKVKIDLPPSVKFFLKNKIDAILAE